MSAELLRTPLAAAHEALGAKMVPFCGWLMPVQYGSIVAEHLHTRAWAGLFDLSHMGRLRVTGPEAANLLQRATTNDVTRAPEGGAQYSLLCNEQGGVLDDLLVYRLKDEWRLIVNAVNRVRVVAHFEAIRDEIACDADIQDETLTTALLGLQGPHAERVLQPLVDGDLSALGYYRARWDVLSIAGRPEPGPHPWPLPQLPALISRTGYTGEDGFEVAVDAEHAGGLWKALLSDERVQPVGLGARDTLRLEAGMALYGHELNEGITPYEAGLGRVVKLDKGDFIGREALVELNHTPPRRSLIGLTFEPGAIPRAGCAVHRKGTLVGEVASGTFSPTLRRPIATAYVGSDAAEPGAELAVSIRNAQVPSRVVSLPFVPHHTKRGLGARP